MAHFDSFPAQPVSSGRAPRRLYERLGKRGLDLTLAMMLVPVLVPFIAVLWLLVRLDGGSGFYAHRRVGQEGRSFRCWKIRTMVPNADARLATHLANTPAAAREWALTQKLTDDPRVTRLGHLLRRTSLDELPQIWNVLRGDMSLVGPRPVTEAELDRYGSDRQVYLKLRPGVTGLWQVTGRSNGCYDERLNLDREYAAGLGLGLDMGLILRTSLVLLRPTGR